MTDAPERSRLSLPAPLLAALRPPCSTSATCRRPARQCNFLAPDRTPSSRRSAAIAGESCQRRPRGLRACVPGHCLADEICSVRL